MTERQPPKPSDKDLVQLVRLRNGFYMRPLNRLRPLVEDPRISMVEITIEVHDGIPVCTGLTVRAAPGEAIDKDTLRRLPLRQYVQTLVSLDAVRISDRNVAEWADEAGTEGLPRRKPRVTDDRLRDVARAYRQAVRAGEPPTRAVQDQQRVSRSTAGRLVQQARDRGFLKPAPGERQAGEQRGPSRKGNKR